MDSVRPWPDLREEDRWLIDELEEQLAESKQTPEEMRTRAAELRSQAAAAEWNGTRDAVLAIADRYEQTAAARTAAR